MFRSLLLPSLLRLRRRGVPARLGSLLMLLQRSPLVKLLPEARVISTSGFSDTLTWAVATIAGLGAFDSVSGATEANVVQVTPSAGSSTVEVTGGQFLNFFFTAETNVVATVASFEVSGTLPNGLFQAGLKNNNRSDYISGVPVDTGIFPITITAWEFVNNTGRRFENSFTIIVAAPPAPEITVQPTGGVFAEGDFVSLLSGASSPYRFIWNKNGVPLPDQTTTIISETALRRYLVPTVNPGTAWSSGNPFNDSAWRPANGGIGYDTSTAQVNYLPHIDPVNGNTQSLMRGTVSVPKPTSAYIRIPFTLTGNTPISSLTLRVKTDDGFVAWLNGTEVAFKNKPVPLFWDSPSSFDAIDAEAVQFRNFDLNSFITLLRPGENLLAIQGMNAVSTSSDFLFGCELIGGTDGANSRRLIIPAVQPGDTGSYTLTAENSEGSDTSDPALVILPPSIETNPADISIPSGTTATLSVEPLSTTSLTYQWYRGAHPDTSNPVAGATDAEFTTPPLTQTTQYWVRIINPAGSADSSTATVTVTVTDPYVIWKNANFTGSESSDPAVSGPTADPDRDGITNEREYVFGTQPKTGEPVPMPVIIAGDQNVTLSFTAKKAIGPGYDGRTRHYAIETTNNLATGPWVDLPTYGDIVANDQTVSAVISTAPGRTYCRLRVWLTP